MKKITKSKHDAIISGVCSGFANYFNIDATWVRILFLVSLFFSWGTSFVVYIALAIIIPNDPHYSTYDNTTRYTKQTKQRKDVTPKK